MVPLAYLACALVWGTTFRAIRICLTGYPPLTGAGLRFALAAGVAWTLVAVGWARPQPRGGRERLTLAASGLLAGAAYALLYVAELHISGGLACVLFATFPLFMSGLAWLLGTERARPGDIVGALVAAGGIALIFSDSLKYRGAIVGCLLALGAVPLSALYTVLLKRASTNAHPLAANALFFPYVALALLASAGLLERGAPIHATAWASGALVYLAVFGSILTFAAYIYLLRRVSLMVLSTLVFVEPIVALLIDAATGEAPLSLRAYVGVAIALAGVGKLLKQRPAAAGC